EEAPAAVVVDAGQAEGSGWELLRRVAAAASGRGAPVLAVISSGDSGAEERALASGASDFVRSPFTDTVLRHRVARLVRSRDDRKSLEEMKARARTLETAIRERTATLERQIRFTGQIIDSLPVSLYVVDRERTIVAW